MTETYERFLEALRCAVRGRSVDWREAISSQEWMRLIRLSQEHSVTPLFAQAVYRCSALAAVPTAQKMLLQLAKRSTIIQARRTAEFLLLYDALSRQGLHPVVMKGIVCRSLYPHPSQRPSVDEDLLIAPEDFSRYHRALTEYGLTLANPNQPLEGADEVSYLDARRQLYIELHMRPFPPDSKAYGDCNTLFAGILDRTVTIQVEGMSVCTLAPTDHLLYLLCHAYKHFLYSGVGIRQICDIGMFTRAYDGEIDWDHILNACQRIRIIRFAAAIFRIAQRHLGFEMPTAFSTIDVDESDLLEDMLSGGLYGASDINRLHSSTMTLEAVAANKTGRRRVGALHSVFLPVGSLSGRYPYLRRHPWLLPVAWVQRVWSYATKKNGSGPINPSESIRIGNNRISLLREYGIID